MKVWPIALGIALVNLAASATTLDDIRLHSVQPDVFEYKFASIVSSRTPITLAFNHSDGSTVFAHVGDPVGRYTLQSVQRHSVERFVESLNATIGEDRSIAILETPEGERVALERGTLLPRGGQVVLLISLANGGWVYARPGESFTLGGESVDVGLSDDTHVTLTTASGSNEVAELSAEERTQIETLWADRHRARERLAALDRTEAAEAEERARVDRMLAEAKVPAAEPRHADPPVTARRITPGFSFGTDFRYPTAYDVIPIVTRNKNGTFTTRSMVVPTRFTTRRMSLGLRGYAR